MSRNILRFLVLPAIAFSLIAFSTSVNAGDRDGKPQRKASSGEYKKGKGKSLLSALIDHHRKERSFILGLIQGDNDREYYEDDREPQPVRNYRKQPLREYHPEPVREYRKEPAPRYTQRPVVKDPAPVPSKPNSTSKYPGYSGY